MARIKIEENYEEAKQRLIYSAINELMELGYSKFTLTSVAQRAGITKAALYWYFPSKEKLVEEVANTVYRCNIKNIESIATSSIDPLNKLKNIFISLQDSQKDKMCIIPIKIFFELSSENNELKNKIQCGYDEYIDLVAKVIQEGIETGAFQTNWSSQDIAKYMVSMFDGAAIQGLILNQDTSNIYELLFEMALPVLINKE